MKSFTVTKISSLKYDLFEVTFNQDQTLVLSGDIVIDGYLFLNKTIDETTFNQLNERQKYLECYQKAMAFISYQPRTKKEVINKLNLTFSNSLINQVIEDLEAKKLIDDKLYKELYIDQCLNRLYGPNKIKQKLYEKGLDQQVDIDDQTIKTNIDKYISKYKFNPQYSLIKQKDQLINKLVALGYQFNYINEAINKIEFIQNDDVIIKELNKLKHKHSRKLQGYELYQKVYYEMIKKGYASQEIKELMEVDDEFSK